LARSPNQVDLQCQIPEPGSDPQIPPDPRTRLICWAGAVRTRQSAGTPQAGWGSFAQGQALGSAIGDVGSAAGLLQTKCWPEYHAGRASTLARSAPRPWTGRLCSPTRVRKPERPSHNVPSRTCAATRCPRGRLRRENLCGTRLWRRNRRQGSQRSPQPRG